MAAFGAERTRHGLLCLPDPSRAGSPWGPIYAAVLRKAGVVNSQMGGVLGKLKEVAVDDGDEVQGDD